MDISRDGKLIASGSDDKTIKIFEVSAKKLIHTFEAAHEGRVNYSGFIFQEITIDFVYAVKISNDNSYIVSGAGDKSIKVFSLKNMTLVHHFSNSHEGKSSP